jgi:hypothetical protein
MKTNPFTFLSREAHLSPAGHFIARSAIILLLWLGGGLLLLLCPTALAAQVTTSNLAISTGSPTTVTFNVQWTNDHAPDFVWSDTVWVFVDYVKDGAWVRLPLSLNAGATLTATSAPGEGRVMEEPENDQGVWVVGNARSAGSFSAAVQLFTAITHITGACAYASEYPPVGKYTAVDKIAFLGTPQFTITIKKEGEETPETRESDGSLFEAPEGYALLSFTDRTGAPGVWNCGENQVSGSEWCGGGDISSAGGCSGGEIRVMNYEL